jgi:hypothetical protein
MGIAPFVFHNNIPFFQREVNEIIVKLKNPFAFSESCGMMICGLLYSERYYVGRTQF